jgi:hypothetical protein
MDFIELDVLQQLDYDSISVLTWLMLYDDDETLEEWIFWWIDSHGPGRIRQLLDWYIFKLAGTNGVMWQKPKAQPWIPDEDEIDEE